MRQFEPLHWRRRSDASSRDWRQPAASRASPACAVPNDQGDGRAAPMGEDETQLLLATVGAHV
jgi:hypothetical protein